MTTEEDNALSIFINIVAELADAEMLATRLICDSTSNSVDRICGDFLVGILGTIRAGHTQAELDKLVRTIIYQEDPSNA